MKKKIILLRVYEKMPDCPEIGRDWLIYVEDIKLEIIHRDPLIGPASYFTALNKNIYRVKGVNLREEHCG